MKRAGIEGWLVAGLGLLVAGCDKPAATPAADDELTIVVEESSRLASQEAALREQQKQLAEERERLRKDFEKLDEGAGAQDDGLRRQTLELLNKQDELAKKLESAMHERETLLNKVVASPAAAPAAAPAGGDRSSALVAVREKEVASREKEFAARERAIAEREAALAQREAALAQRDSACMAAAKTQVDRSQRPTKAAVEKAYKDLMSAMDAKGLLLADLSPTRRRHVSEAMSARSAGELERALDAIESAMAAVAATSIDGDFVSGKVKRVNAMQKRASSDAKVREEIGRLLGEVTRSYSDGRFREANQALNNIVSLIDKQGK